MRFVIYGAGAIGGVLGARLSAAGYDVVLIARGPHLAAIQSAGLRVDDPDTSTHHRLPAVASPAELELGANDVVLVTTKSHSTTDVLAAVAEVADPATPIVCLQNGVANERTALRLFANVYGVCVMFPAAHLEAGVVQAQSAPITGLLDVGRYPDEVDEEDEVDETADQIAAAFRAATFSSRPRHDIMAWKYRKLIMNLGNAVQAACGREADTDDLVDRVRGEGLACLRAAGISVISAEEDEQRRANLLRVRPVGGTERLGGSSWQSLYRQTGSIETDYLNGEIVLLGRLHQVPTPANELVRQVANRMARDGQPPGSIPVEKLYAQLG